jgi:cytochrome c556
MRRYLVAAVLCLIVAGGFCVNARSQPKTDLRAFMRAKLSLSQKALEGLVLDDLPAVEDAAEKMKVLSLDESWKVLQTAEYVEFSRKFRADADELAVAARKNKLEGATAAFHKLTSRCVECHKYVRDVRMARVD